MRAAVPEGSAAPAPLRLLLVLCLVVSLGACSALGGIGAPQPTGGSPTTLDALPATAGSAGEQASSPANARFYRQQVTWSSCGADGLQCTNVLVPVDWAAPSGATLSIALNRYPARKQSGRKGSLLFDPGGPGVSGVDFVEQSHGRVGSSALTDAYDVVGIDPRGTGASSPVECLSDPQFDTYLSEDVDADTPAGLAELTTRSQQFAQGCARDAGSLLGHLGTVDAARDMDVVRAALGEKRLNYLGVSYGTLLGATYAGMFPRRVGRFVLDGALDPKSSAADIDMMQAKGLERELRTYVERCPQRSACPLSHDTDRALTQIRDLLSSAETDPLPTGTPRPLTRALATTGVIAPLYDDAAWSALDDALAQALRGNGRGLLSFADLYDDRSSDGTFDSNELQAFTAIDCLDYPVDDSLATMQAEAKELEAASPTFGDALSYSALQCGVWPVRPTRTPGPITAKGAPPILVVGNSGDPITPYPWAQSLASQLTSGRLLTYDGQGHASYNRGSECIDGAVDGYLVDGVLPGKGATCQT